MKNNFKSGTKYHKMAEKYEQTPQHRNCYFKPIKKFYKDSNIRLKIIFTFKPPNF